MTVGRNSLCFSAALARFALLRSKSFTSANMSRDPDDAILGGEITEHVREVGVNYHYPLHISGTRYVLDTTPPVQVDIAALRRALGR